MILLGIALLAAETVPKAQSHVPPPPPVQSIEIFRPTYQSTTVRPQCGTGSEISWRFGPAGVTFTSAKIVGLSDPAGAAKQLTALAREITGNVFVRVECDSTAATIALIATDGAAPGKTKQIRLNTRDGGLIVVRRYRFP